MRRLNLCPCPSGQRASPGRADELMKWAMVLRIGFSERQTLRKGVVGFIRFFTFSRGHTQDQHGVCRWERDQAVWRERPRCSAGLTAASAAPWAVWSLDLIFGSSQVSQQMRTTQEGHDAGRGTFTEGATGDLGNIH